jgi:hypothetical protein
MSKIVYRGLMDMYEMLAGSGTDIYMMVMGWETQLIYL